MLFDFGLDISSVAERERECVGVNERKEEIHRLLTCTKAKYGCVYYMTNPQFCVAMLYSMFCQVVLCVCVCVCWS